MSVAELEDAALCRILAVTLEPQSAGISGSDGKLYLAGLAQVTAQLLLLAVLIMGCMHLCQAFPATRKHQLVS